MRRIALGILISVAVGLLLAQTPAVPRWPQRRLPPDMVADVITLAPRQYSIEVQNDQVRVLRAKLGPGDTVPTHYAGPGTFVALTDVHVRIIRPDQRTQDVELQRGQVQWIAEDTYSAKNLSNGPIEFLFIEMGPAHTRPATP